MQTDSTTVHTQLDQLTSKLEALTNLVIAQQDKIAQLEDQIKQQNQTNSATDTARPVSTSQQLGRRRFLRQWLATAAGTALVTGGLVISSEKAQAGLVTRSNPGAVIVPGGTQVGGSVSNGKTYGLAATNDTGTFSLGNLPSQVACGIFGYSTNDNAVAGTSVNQNGLYGVSLGSYSGVYGESSQAYGVYGKSFGNKDTNPSTGSAGVYGEATNTFGMWGFSTNKAGVYGNSGYGSGVFCTSLNGYCLETGKGALINKGQVRIWPKDDIGAPSTGTPLVGEIFVDNTGAMFIYTNTGWKRVQLVAP
jgi:hypothetical protein